MDETYSDRSVHDERLAEPNALLRAAVEIASEALSCGGFALAAPVAAQFQTVAGSGGVELIVRLQDLTAADAARHALVERFGGGRGPTDRFVVR